MKTIADVATEMDRLFPDQVDRTECDWGRGYQAGHIGHAQEVDGLQTVGWFCAGGSTGNPVLRIATEDIDRAADLLAAMKQTDHISDVEELLTQAGVRFESAY